VSTEILGGEEQSLFLNPHFKESKFLPLAHSVPMWKEILASEEEKSRRTELQRSCRTNGNKAVEAVTEA